MKFIKRHVMNLYLRNGYITFIEIVTSLLTRLKLTKYFLRFFWCYDG